MPQQKGRLLLIKIGDGASPEQFLNLAGMKTRSFNLSAGEIDTTIPDRNNPGGKVQKTSEPGIVNRTFSGSGAFVSDATQAVLMAAVREATIFNAQVIVPGEGTYTGPWMVSDFQFSGEMEGNMDFSATFNAAGPLTFVAETNAPVNGLLPSIAGIAKVGQVLTANVGSWNGAPVFSYQWKKAGTNIAGATTETYVPVTGDIAASLSVAVTAANSSGSLTVVSGGTANVVA